MLVKVLLYLVLALVWVGLTGEVTLPAFVTGIIIGIIIMKIYGAFDGKSDRFGESFLAKA